MKYKLVAFDMDGTLIEEYSSWGHIHRHFGTADRAMKNLETWESGGMDYTEFMRRDAELWGPGTKLELIEQILSDFKLVPSAPEVVSGLRERGYQTVILTGGLDILADKVAAELGIENVLANGLEVDGDGYLTGDGIFRVDPLRKEEALGGFASGLGLTLDDCVGVGDSKYDASFIESVGLGVAVGGDEELGRVADVTIKDLRELLDHL